MYKIAQMPAAERDILFGNTAAHMGVNAAIVEKDFWVCLTLDYLFHKCRWKDRFAFKGGTSLSKAYGLIERFSEDIDLILDWRTVGFGTMEPWEKRSNTKQQAFNDAANEKTAKFLAEEFLPVFQNEMSEIIGCSASVFIAEDDPQTVHFEYPCSYQDQAILRSIRLEIGALAAWTPTQLATIRPYAADHYGRVFSCPQTEILTTSAARSFWEKVTILHQEANRPEHLNMPSRYSRHYYDLYRMALTPVKEEALRQPDLLQKVADFKIKFYPRKWAQYEQAKPGTIKLMPPSHSEKALRDDYANMRAMIYGEYPSYETIMETLQALENEMNGK